MGLLLTMVILGIKVLLSFPSTSPLTPFLISHYPFIHSDPLGLTILFSIKFHTQNYCVIAGDRKSVTFL